MLTGATPTELRDLKKIQDEQAEAFLLIKKNKRRISSIIGGIKRRENDRGVDRRRI